MFEKTKAIDKSIIQKEYPIEEIKEIEKSENSTDGNVYIINTSNNKYVFKIYSDFSHVNSMIKLHTHLYNNNFYVPKVILTNDNSLYVKVNDEKYIVLYSFLKGKSLGYNFNNVTDDMIKEFALQLRKIHDITSNDNKFLLKELPFAKNIDIKRCSALHFDLTKDNIFYLENKIGFIDFDDAKYGASVCDVAIAITNLFFSKTRGADLKSANLFINSYYNTDYTLKESEVKYIKKYALSWLEYILSGNEFDTSTTESFKVRQKLIEENL